MELIAEPPKPKTKQVHQKTKRIFTDLLKILNLNPTDLARELSTTGADFSQQVIATYVSGASKANEKVLEAIALRYPKVNTRWLLTGKGEPLVKDGKPSNAEAESSRSETPEQLAPDSQMRIIRPTYEELAAENASLHKRLDEKDEVISDLRKDKGQLWQQNALLIELGKEDASPDAAAPANPFAWLSEPHRQVNGLVRYDLPESACAHYDMATGQRVEEAQTAKAA